MKKSIKKSRTVAGLVGPTLTLLVLSELKIWNPGLYDEQITPLIYVSGVLFFLAGLAIVRYHNIWNFSWQVVVTILGWLAMVLGTMRMFFPQQYKANFDNNIQIFIVEIILISLGLFLSLQAYFPRRKKK